MDKMENLRSQLNEAIKRPEGVTEECHHIASCVNVINSGLRASKGVTLSLMFGLKTGRMNVREAAEDIARLQSVILTFAEIADDFGSMAAEALNLTPEQIHAEAKRQSAIVERNIVAQCGEAEALDGKGGDTIR